MFSYHVYMGTGHLRVAFVRNISIRHMRLKLGKNYETFKKHRQAEFQIIT